MEAPGSQHATMRGAHLGIKQTLKEAEGTEGKKVGFRLQHGNASSSLTSSSPQLLDVLVSKPINYVHFLSPFKTAFQLLCHQSIPNRHLHYLINDKWLTESLKAPRENSV